MIKLFIQHQETGLFLREYNTHYKSIQWCDNSHYAQTFTMNQNFAAYTAQIRECMKDDKATLVVWRRVETPIQFLEGSK